MSNKAENERLTENEFLSLHSKYKESGDIRLRNRLVMNFDYIAKTVAMQLRGLSASYAQMEDMVNQGIITLIDCIERFDVSKGVKFESYAFMRVRGGIIDLVRKQDWIPRRVRVTAKQIAAVHGELCCELRREPTQEEIAERMGITVKKLVQYSEEIATSVTLSFEELIENVSQMGNLMENTTKDDLTPEKRLISEEMLAMLKNAIDSLSERERLVVTLYYYENLNLSEIAQVLDVSIQRVSQINSKAVMKMKTSLEDYLRD